MKTITFMFGAFHSLCFIAGGLGMIDYHVCIKGPGKCRIEAAHGIKENT
jgi:hypothetical protein